MARMDRTTPEKGKSILINQAQVIASNPFNKPEEIPLLMSQIFMFAVIGSLFLCSVPISSATKLDFSPPSEGRSYGDRVAVPEQYGYKYQLQGGITPNISVQWENDYNYVAEVNKTLSHVRSGLNYQLGVKFTADAGHTVNLHSFDLASSWQPSTVKRISVVGTRGVIHALRENVTVKAAHTWPTSWLPPTTIAFDPPISDTELRLEIDWNGSGPSHTSICIDNVYFTQDGKLTSCAATSGVRLWQLSPGLQGLDEGGAKFYREFEVLANRQRVKQVTMTPQAPGDGVATTLSPSGGTHITSVSADTADGTEAVLPEGPYLIVAEGWAPEGNATIATRDIEFPEAATVAGAPLLENFVEAQMIEPVGEFEFRWGASANPNLSNVRFRILSESGTVVVNEYLSPDDRSYILPANRLHPGGSYQGEIAFLKRKSQALYESESLEGPVRVFTYAGISTVFPVRADPTPSFKDYLRIYDPQVIELSPSEDFDGDGIPTAMEYLLGGNPFSTSSYPDLLKVGINDFSFVRFDRSDLRGVLYDWEVSKDLRTWEEVSAIESVEATDSGFVRASIARGAIGGDAEEYSRLVMRDPLLSTPKIMALFSETPMQGGLIELSVDRAIGGLSEEATIWIDDLELPVVSVDAEAGTVTTVAPLVSRINRIGVDIGYGPYFVELPIDLSEPALPDGLTLEEAREDFGARMAALGEALNSVFGGDRNNREILQALKAIGSDVVGDVVEDFPAGGDLSLLSGLSNSGFMDAVAKLTAYLDDLVWGRGWEAVKQARVIQRYLEVISKVMEPLFVVSLFSSAKIVALKILTYVGVLKGFTENLNFARPALLVPGTLGLEVERSNELYLGESYRIGLKGDFVATQSPLESSIRIIVDWALGLSQKLVDRYGIDDPDAGFVQKILNQIVNNILGLRIEESGPNAQRLRANGVVFPVDLAEFEFDSLLVGEETIVSNGTQVVEETGELSIVYYEGTGQIEFIPLSRGDVDIALWVGDRLQSDLLSWENFRVDGTLTVRNRYPVVENESFGVVVSEDGDGVFQLMLRDEDEPDREMLTVRVSEAPRYGKVAGDLGSGFTYQFGGGSDLPMPNDIVKYFEVPGTLDGEPGSINFRISVQETKDLVENFTLEYSDQYQPDPGEGSVTVEVDLSAVEAGSRLVVSGLDDVEYGKFFYREAEVADGRRPIPDGWGIELEDSFLQYDPEFGTPDGHVIELQVWNHSFDGFSTSKAGTIRLVAGSPDWEGTMNLHPSFVGDHPSNPFGYTQVVTRSLFQSSWGTSSTISFALDSESEKNFKTVYQVGGNIRSWVCRDFRARIDKDGFTVPYGSSVSVEFIVEDRSAGQMSGRFEGSVASDGHDYPPQGELIHFFGTWNAQKAVRPLFPCP